MTEIYQKFQKDIGPIVFVPHRSPEKAHLKLTVCSTSVELHRLFEGVRTIHLSWGSVCPVSIIPLINQCNRCSLLGHRDKHCPKSDSTPSPLLSKPNKCLDCQNYNTGISQAKLGRWRLRWVDHRTGDPQCPTKVHIVQKKRNNPVVDGPMLYNVQVVDAEMAGSSRTSVSAKVAIPVPTSAPFQCSHNERQY